MKRILLVLGLLVFVFGISGDFVAAKGGKNKRHTSLTGHLYGILAVPAEEMAKIPDEDKNLRFAKEAVSDFEE